MSSTLKNRISEPSSASSPVAPSSAASSSCLKTTSLYARYHSKSLTFHSRGVVLVAGWQTYWKWIEMHRNGSTCWILMHFATSGREKAQIFEESSEVQLLSWPNLPGAPVLASSWQGVGSRALLALQPTHRDALPLPTTLSRPPPSLTVMRKKCANHNAPDKSLKLQVVIITSRHFEATKRPLRTKLHDGGSTVLFTMRSQCRAKKLRSILVCDVILFVLW